MEDAMQVNQLPRFDKSNNPTGCCPRFDPAGWDGQELTFNNKRFVKASTVSLFHMPLNMGGVFKRTFDSIERAHANTDEFLVLSHDDSPWHAEHLFAVDHDVPGADMIGLSGTFLTRVFEGPYANVKEWCSTLEKTAKAKGKSAKELYYFYTTCPKCAKVYRHNYVVGFAKVESLRHRGVVQRSSSTCAGSLMMISGPL
jgi:hypothetical protein